MFDLAARTIPDLFCVWLALWGSTYEERVASHRIREYLDAVRSRPDGTIGMVSEEGLLQLFRLLKGSITNFMGMIVAALSVLFSLVILYRNWGAVVGIPMFMGPVTIMSIVWMGTSLDTVDTSTRLQRGVFLVFLLVSLLLKAYEFIRILHGGSSGTY